MNVVPLRPGLATTATPVHFVGRLTASLPDSEFEVEDEHGESWRCRRAASCLLRPEAGDTVLLSGPDSARVYLIAVLEQVDSSVSRLDAAGALSIESPAGLRLSSGAELQMRAAQWNLQAASGQCRVDDMRFTGQALDATVGRLRLVGQVFESVADRVVQMATKLVIEPLFEADFLPCSYGFRPKRSATQALEAIRKNGNRTTRDDDR